MVGPAAAHAGDMQVLLAATGGRSGGGRGPSGPIADAVDIALVVLVLATAIVAMAAIGRRRRPRPRPRRRER